MEIAALGEGYSNHPIAASIKEAYGKAPDLTRVAEASEIAGHGIEISVDGKKTYIGNEKLMAAKEITYKVNKIFKLKSKRNKLNFSRCR